MGIFRFVGTDVDTTDINLFGIEMLPIVASTATRLTLGTTSSEYSVTATGTGFSYVFIDGQIVDVTSGTLMTFSGRDNEIGENNTFSFTNLGLSMSIAANYVFSGNWAAFTEYLFSRADNVTGTGNADVLASFAGNDSVFGEAGNDSLIGGVGDDRLFGGTGADTLRGGSDTDVLFGGLGADELRGGGGRDAFVFNSALGATQRDRITDFSALDDVIRLENAIFTAFTNSGTMVQSRFHLGVAAADGGDRIIYDRAEGVLSYDRDGTGSAAQVVFAILNPGTALGYQDIVII